MDKAEMLDCPKCKVEIIKKQKFCSICGENLQKEMKTPKEIEGILERLKGETEKIKKDDDSGRSIAKIMMFATMFMGVSIAFDWVQGGMEDSKFIDVICSKDK